ncbi:MAG: hypothetical protein GY722_02385 [bacterium]|nr:hypothetical protein [bacterium]
MIDESQSEAEAEGRESSHYLRCRGVAGTAVLAVVIGSLISLPRLAVAAQIIPGTDQEAAELVADLPWRFEVSQERSSAPEANEKLVQVTQFRFKSTEPYEQTPDGPIYLRAQLSTHEHDTAFAAESAFDDLLASADPVIGLSYAWDHILVNGTIVYHLHVPCLFSEARFREMAAELEKAIRRQAASSPRATTCRCGTGCRHAMLEEVANPVE